MRHIVHTLAPPLSCFVANLWALVDATGHSHERIVATGTQELVINLREDEIRIYDPLDQERCQRFSGAIVSGAYRGFFVIDTRAHASLIGVHFKPGGALPFLGLPPGALADQQGDLETLWGSSGARSAPWRREPGPRCRRARRSEPASLHRSDHGRGRRPRFRAEETSVQRGTRLSMTCSPAAQPREVGS